MRLVRAGEPPDTAALARWSRAAMSSDLDGPRRAVVDRYVVTVVPRPGEDPRTTFARIREMLMAYDIYPRSALLFGIHPSGQLEHGSVIVQRLQFGAGAIEAGVRVMRVWDSDVAAGFAYVTLQGHPELGTEYFGVQRQPDGRVRVGIEARSRPGQALTWLGLPVARAVQVGVSRAAVRRLAR